MALAQKQNRQRTTTLIIALVIVAVGGIVTYSIVTSKPSDSTSGTVVSGRSNDLPLVTNFGNELYASPQFQSLHDYSKDIDTSGQVPTPVPSSRTSAIVNLPASTLIGRDNPFD